MNTGCFSLGSTSRFLLVRFFAVASIIGVGDIGAGFSDESLADKSLARTQQRSIVAAGSARTALNPGGTARFFTINEILDKSDRPAALPMPVPNDEPFGMMAFVQPEGPLATKWHEIQVDLAEEEPILKECVADESKCTSAAARFVAIVMTISQQIGRARLELAFCRDIPTSCSSDTPLVAIDDQGATQLAVPYAGRATIEPTSGAIKGGASGELNARDTR